MREVSCGTILHTELKSWDNDIVNTINMNSKLGRPSI